MADFKPLKPSILGQDPATLAAAFSACGEPAYRAKQVVEWLYKKGARDFASMSNLPNKTREWLEGAYTLLPASLVLAKQASDTTEKLLLELEDGSYIETVILSAPEGDDAEEGARMTLCVSSQVGCAFGCKFCASGMDGWKRNLLTSEIIAQVMIASRHIAQKAPLAQPRTLCGIDNIVFMGMGEPLANYDNVLKAIEIINADWGLGLGARRITVSTCGLAPKIEQLANEPIRFRLALSLHGASDQVRTKIMPVNRAHPLSQLIAAVKRFAQKHGRMVTFEYILIEEVNDSLDQATELARIATEVHAHVNLIPYNPVPGLEWKRPSIGRQRAFLSILERARVSCTIRRQKGDDIDAACGQLRLRKERERRQGEAGPSLPV